MRTSRGNRCCDEDIRYAIFKVLQCEVAVLLVLTQDPAACRGDTAIPRRSRLRKIAPETMGLATVQRKWRISVLEELREHLVDILQKQQ